MPKVMKVCKECGKEYEACHTPNPGVWRWRDIACSYDCAMKYVARVEAARKADDEKTRSGNVFAATPEPERKVEPVATAVESVGNKTEEPVATEEKTVERSAFVREDDSLPRFMRNRRK